MYLYVTHILGKLANNTCILRLPYPKQATCLSAADCTAPGMRARDAAKQAHTCAFSAGALENKETAAT